MSNDHLADKSLNPLSVSDLTGVNVSEGMARNLVNNAIRQQTSMIKADFAANAGTITAASTTTLASISTGDYILLTPSGGSSSISSFGTATEGLSKRIRALGTLILRYDAAKLDLPGGADITISTGDEIYCRAQGATLWNVTHQPYSGIPNAVVNATSITASEASSFLILDGQNIRKADGRAISGFTNQTDGYLALSAAHTISSGDNKYVLDFTTAGVTCAFVPLASLSDGFSVTIMNSASTGVVTLNPDGTETIDTVATRALQPGDKCRLVKTSTAFKTLSGIYSSAAATISASSVDSFAHGLSLAPQDYGAYIVADATPELGYTAGQRVDVGVFQGGVTPFAVSVYADGTNVNITWGNSLPYLMNLSTFLANTQITATKWTVVLWARV